MTLLIKSVQVLGSPLKLPERVDVFINGDRISAIGNFPDKKADFIFDGQGAYLAPGFIDVNTDSDHYLSLFDDPAQGDFLSQGVTTIVGGNCGSSLAPLIYGSLESVQKWGNINKVNVDWHTIAEFLKLIEKRPLGVNFLTLVGHSTIRRALIGGTLRDLTKNELGVFSETLKRGLGEGASGFSTGLGYVHSHQTPYAEIKLLVNIVRESGGVYSTHLRNNGPELKASIDETIRVSEETGAKVLISHFLPLKGVEKEYEEALETIERLPGDRDFHFDIYPFDTSVIPLYKFLPDWVQNGGIEVMVSNVLDKWLEPRIVKDLPKIAPYDFIIGQATDNTAFVGKSLRDLMELYSLQDPREALMKLMITTKLRASIHFKNINTSLVNKGLIHRRSFIASNSASTKEGKGVKKLERTTSTFTKFLSLVQDEKIMSLEDAIRKITLLPARKFNVERRGEIKEGNFADLTCFRGSEIKLTVVNGQVAYMDGMIHDKSAGRPLRSHG
ncbi:MAG: amidohydrolase family protein [Patescibacteria group bacterium]